MHLLTATLPGNVHAAAVRLNAKGLTPYIFAIDAGAIHICNVVFRVTDAEHADVLKRINRL